jgi:hypothetical protein
MSSTEVDRLDSEAKGPPLPAPLPRSPLTPAATARLQLRQSLSFFTFGLVNNVLYVLVLSAALDLVPPATPKGIVALANIAPALAAKAAWPYLLTGPVRYARRVAVCCALSATGMLVRPSARSRACSVLTRAGRRGVRRPRRPPPRHLPRLLRLRSFPPHLPTHPR